jgi:TPR repeat protein
MEWIKRAAKQGDPDILYRVGVAYFYGNGSTAKNEKEAMEHWLLEAAERGHPEAQVECIYSLFKALLMYRLWSKPVPNATPFPLEDQTYLNSTRKRPKHVYLHQYNCLGTLLQCFVGKVLLKEGKVDGGVAWLENALKQGHTVAFQSLLQYYGDRGEVWKCAGLVASQLRKQLRLTSKWR